jgi:hypothetical protein
MTSCSNTLCFKALERPPTPSDELPAGVNFGETKMDKVLLVAEAGGKKYFLDRTPKS